MSKNLKFTTDYYKLHPGISPIYKVTTKEDFEQLVGATKDYWYFDENGVRYGLAFCPCCDNRVKIIFK